jgi:copper chaperone CopZ
MSNQNTVTQLFSVPSMHCSACVMLLEGLEDEVEGIVKVEASFKRQQMLVEYDETKVTPDAIVAAAKKEGYNAAPITVNQ